MVRVQNELVGAVKAVALVARHGDAGGHLIGDVVIGCRADLEAALIAVRLLGWDHLTGRGVIIFQLVAVAQRHLVAHIHPVAVRLDVVVVVHGVDRGDVVAVRVAQFGEIPRHHVDQAQRKFLHAVDLHPVGDQALIVFVRRLDHVLQHLRRVPFALAVPEVLLGDKLLQPAGLPIDAPRLGDTALRVDVGDQVLGDRLLDAVRLEVSGAAEDKVGHHLVLQIFVHVKAACEQHRHVGQHHRQREGEHHQQRLDAAAAKVCPGHREKRRTLPLPRFGPAGSGAHVGVAHRLHRGDPGRHPARLAAGEQDGEQRKQRRPDEDEGTEADKGIFVGQLLHDDGGQLVADQKAQHQPDGDADEREQQRLAADDALKLAAGGADGLEQAIELDVVGDRNLKDVVDNQIPGEDDEQQQGGDGDDGQRVSLSPHLRSGVAPVDAAVDVVVRLGVGVLIAVVFQQLCQVALDVQRACKHHVQRPPAGHVVSALVLVALQRLLGAALRQQDVAGGDRLVVLPPAGEGEGLGDLLRIAGADAEIVGDGELLAHLRLDTQQPQHPGIGGGLVGALPGQAALDRHAEVVGSQLRLHVADLDVRLVKRLLLRHP